MKCCTGPSLRGVKIAGQVALSFVRAHQGWLLERYQRLAVHPRHRQGFSYHLGHDDLSAWNDGASYGAAYAGKSRMVCNDTLYAYLPKPPCPSLVICGSRVSIQVILSRDACD